MKRGSRIAEGLAEILASESVFYNPVQEFNRDMSIAAINVWLETRHKSSSKDADSTTTTIFEGLSATGLRSIRYAKEIILPAASKTSLKIIANDFDESARASIDENIILNNVQDKVQSSLGDASYIMHLANHENKKFSVVDLDPYGSATQFLDAAVQSIQDGGLLCITCTDMGVLAGGQSETNFSKYGGVNLTSTPYCHEFALRSVLHCLQTTAARYKRAITPLASCSIDFYVRLFVQIDHSPKETKKCASKTSLVYHCHTCKSFVAQSLGLLIQDDKSTKYRTNKVPVSSSDCNQCGSPWNVAGPFYGDKLHDIDFVKSMIEHVKSHPKKYGTHLRMMGMLTVISEELELPFYYSASMLANAVHCVTPSMNAFSSALIHAGHKISITHCAQNCIKTTAPSSVIWDIMRSHIGKHPIKTPKIGSFAERLLATEPSFIADFSKHPDCEAPSKKIKLIRFQENPTSHWGPKQKARRIYDAEDAATK